MLPIPDRALHLPLGMTQPRRVLQGATVMITRRTVRRTHLLCPDRELTELFTYVLALTAARHGMSIHAVTVMATHEHIVLTDVNALLPKFLHDLHRLLALGVQALRKWKGPVWDQQKTSVVELCTPDAIVEKMAYVMANPVAAGLVQHAYQWPGLTTRPSELGAGCRTVRRPDYFFDPNNPEWPPTATLSLTMPPTGQSLAQLRASVVAELSDLEREAQADVRRRRRSFASPRSIASRSPFARATSEEPVRSLNPVIAVGRRNSDALRNCLATLRGFRSQYRTALEAWRTGLRDALFPPGTWWMSVFHSARLEAG